MEEIRNVMATVLQMPRQEIVDTLVMDGCESWDSLKHMELIAAIEEHLGCELTFEEIVTMRSFQDIERVVASRGDGD